MLKMGAGPSKELIRDRHGRDRDCDSAFRVTVTATVMVTDKFIETIVIWDGALWF
jgi:hypothetical protein